MTVSEGSAMTVPGRPVMVSVLPLGMDGVLPGVGEAASVNAS